MATSQKIYPLLPQVGRTEWYELRWHSRWQTLRSALQNTQNQLASKLHMDIMAQTLEDSAQYRAAQVAVANTIREAFGALPWASESELRKAYLQFEYSYDGTGAIFFHDSSGAVLPSLPDWVPALSRLQQLRYDFEKSTHAKNVVDDLNLFADAAVNFFCTGIFHGPEDGAQVPLTRRSPYHEDIAYARLLDVLAYAAAELVDFTPGALPANYVLRMLLAQISVDLNIVQAAVNQRADQDLYESSLPVADEFARLAIEPAMDRDFLDQKQVLAYLNQRVEVRLLPYHDTVLIGVPFAARSDIELVSPILPTGSDPNGANNEPEGMDAQSILQRSLVDTGYLAIPHEVGHLVELFLNKRG